MFCPGGRKQLPPANSLGTFPEEKIVFGCFFLIHELANSQVPNKDVIRTDVSRARHTHENSWS